MGAKEMRAIYEDLYSSGDLLDMFPTLTGNWKEDKKDFKELYNQVNNSFGTDFNIYFGDEEY
jgi:hypothetical protein